jgi:hypothetical protein
MATKTIAFGQVKKYARVADRLMEFRTANPNALIETTPTVQPDGSILFKARILKDKATESSGEATGHALGENKGTKAFEKLETIAVGRALALLGYAADGEIASSEEMEEFETYKKQKEEEMLFAAQEKLEGCTSLDELKTAWAEISVEAKTALADLKETMKVKLTK